MDAPCQRPVERRYCGYEGNRYQDEREQSVPLPLRNERSSGDKRRNHRTDNLQGVWRVRSVGRFQVQTCTQVSVAEHLTRHYTPGMKGPIDAPLFLLVSRVPGRILHSEVSSRVRHLFAVFAKRWERASPSPQNQSLTSASQFWYNYLSRNRQAPLGSKSR